MTTKAQLRKAALALPEVEEVAQSRMLEFQVNGKSFASLTEDGFVKLTLTEEAAEHVLAHQPTAERDTRAGNLIEVSVALDDVNGMELNSLVIKAWLSRAPRRLTQPWLAAARGEAPVGPDALPKSIGKPATRALLAAGLELLPDVAKRSEAELAALHGVGPKAVRLLGEALAERGLDFSPGRP